MKKINLYYLLLLGIVTLAFILLIGISKSDSQTTDESVHLFAGYTYLTKNDFRLDPEHPPFLKELAGLPLLFFRDIKVPIDGLWDKAGNFYYDSWKEARGLGENFFYSVNSNADQILFWGRLPFILLTLFLGLFAYFWANRLYGQKAGIFAAFLILLMPNILAHGHLINTDLGLTVFAFISIYFWGKFLKSASWRIGWANLSVAGLLLGLAFASKYTSVILIPIIFLLAVAKLFTDDDFKNWRRYLLGFFGAGIIGFIIVWASYGFTINLPPQPIGSFSQNIQMWASYNIPTVFDGIFAKARPFLFPADFYKGLVLVVRHALGGHGAYLLGENSNFGWWYYFPVAIFYKTPLAFFAFLALAIGYFKRIRAKLIFDELILIIAPLVYLLISMSSKADLGVRHVLPIFPFLAVFAAKSINMINFSSLKLWTKNRVKFLATVGFIVLVLWYLYSSLSNYPNYLSYFNEAAGGPSNGSKILTDSNLDWGQDIYRIKKYVAEHSDGKYSLTYPWDGEPALLYYGLNYPLVTPDDIDVKGEVIISATYARTDAYSWLWQFPHENITPGVLVFHLPDES